MDPLHPCDYTPDVLEMMRIDYEDPDREPGSDAYTPTRIIDCQRKQVLMGDQDWYFNPDHSYPATRGHMVHALMEKTRWPGALMTIREHRFETTVMTSQGPKPFSGKSDAVIITRIEDGVAYCVVVDYKSVGEIGHDLIAAKPQHQWQVNMYAWMVEECLPAYLNLPTVKRAVVEELVIEYCSMKKSRLFTSKGWRKTRGKLLDRKNWKYATLDLEPIDLYPTSATYRAIQGRIEARLKAEQVLPPVLEEPEDWVCAFCPVRETCERLAKANVRVLPIAS